MNDIKKKFKLAIRIENDNKIMLKSTQKQPLVVSEIYSEFDLTMLPNMH